MSDHPALTAALADLVASKPAYDEAAAFYEGTPPEILTSKKLRRLFRGAASAFRINYARTPVDVLVERTTVQGITCSDQAQQTLLDQSWEDNELGIEAKDLHRRAYEFGDAYLIAWPEDEDPEYPSGVSAYAHDPTEVRVFYDPARPRRKSHAVHWWHEAGSEENGLTLGETFLRVNLYFPDRLEKWVSLDPAVDRSGVTLPVDHTTAFVRYLDEDGAAWPIPNPTPGVIPVFHFRTGRPYGRPEHADAYGPQNAINKLVISLMGATDHAVLPQRYALADEADARTGPIGDDLYAPVAGDGDEITPDSAVALRGKQDMGSDPGDTWLMRGVKAVGQFAAADTKNFIDPVTALVQAMADVTDMPANRYHRGGQSPAADSQRMDEAPLRAKTADRHALFGVTWHEFFAYVCLVNNITETDAQIAWAPPENYNDKASWEAAHLQLEAGVPFAQVMRERGYVTETVAEWEKALPDGKPPILGEAGTEIGVGLGDPPEVV